MEDSSDVREAPAGGPLLFQDVVGLAQGLLGGGAGLSFSLAFPSKVKRGGVCGRLPDTARAREQMTHGSCRQMTEAGNTGDGQERPVVSQGKAYTGRLTHTEPRPDNAGAHTHTRRRQSIQFIYRASAQNGPHPY